MYNIIVYNNCLFLQPIFLNVYSSLKFLVDSFIASFVYCPCFIPLVAPPRISNFLVEDHYISESNHSLSCTVVYDANSTINVELQFCNNNTFKPITTDPVFTLRQFPELKVVGLCIRQRTVLYTFNFTQVSAGLFLRCSVTDYSLNINKTTECVPLFLQPPGNSFK